MSIGAQVATLPVVVARFGAYYPSGLAAGLVLVPLTTALLWAGLAWLPLFAVPWPFLHDLFARACGLLYAAIDWCANLFAGVPGLVVGPGAGAVIAAAAAALMACLVLFFPRPRPRRLRWSGAA
jgi:hypothetical protein